MGERGGQTDAGLPLPPGERPYFLSDDGRVALLQGDCLALMPRMPGESFDLIFADPPYFLSNDGITCHAGKMVSVNKGKWDRSRGFRGNYDFTRRWLSACRRLLKPHGSIWVSGTSHIIHIVGCCLDELGYKTLNDITWVKPNPPPNLSCRYFVHATETILWAGRDRKSRHKFNYQLMKRLNHGKQMKSVWTIDPPGKGEKAFGKHPTQKPLALLERIIAAASDEGDTVLDPFVGAGTTAIAARRLNRRALGVDQAPENLFLAERRFLGVPQADRPDRMLRLLQMFERGPHDVASQAGELGVSPRQVRYYRHALRALGLLEAGAAGNMMTGLGWGATSGPLAQRRQVLAAAILEFPLVQEASRRVRRLRGTAARRRWIAAMLDRFGSVNGTTCSRRAQTLLSWLAWATGVRDGAPAASDELVSPPADEPEDSPVPKDLELLPDLVPNVPVTRVENPQLRFEFVDLLQAESTSPKPLNAS
jgi:site-specific DNA-methyltransferase (adenine-specific)